MNRKSLGIYIHIPFCRQKCPYCDFYSIKPDPGAVQAYTNALIREIESKEADPYIVDTVYFGGGTPLCLGVDNLITVLNAITARFHCMRKEYTFEANPKDVDLRQMQQLRKAGFNRISFGLQSSDQNHLHRLGRKHTADDFIYAVGCAKEAGFKNISADLMLGLPNQTQEDIQKSVELLKILDIQHVSAYLLKIEPSTPFYRDNVKTLCPTEDQTADLYLYTVGLLEREGFHQYEISNFSRSGFESAHNLKYWQMEEYFGIGVSAHSFSNGKRYAHDRDMQRYLKNAVDYDDIDEHAGGFDEYAMLALRLTKGMDLNIAKERYHTDIPLFLKKAKPFEKAGLLVIQDGRIALTPNGFLGSNYIISRLIF